MARPGRPERNRAARSFRQLRRFHHVINSNKVFGTHTCRLPQPARWAAKANTALSEIDTDGDVSAHQLGNGSCMCQQLRECRVLRQSFLRLAIHFPTGIARNNQPLSGPYAGVEPGQAKKFGAMFFEDCLRILGVLDHFLCLVAFKARHLRDRHTYLPWFGLTDRALALPISDISELYLVFPECSLSAVLVAPASSSAWRAT